MSAAENKALVRRMLVEAFTTADPERLAQDLFTDDWVNVDPSLPPLPRGPEGGLQLFKLFRAAFSAIELTVDDDVAEGDRVAANFTFAGTHTGDFMGVAPTGKRIQATATGIFRISGGKVAQNRVNLDALGMLQQLGVVPKPERASA